MKKIALVSLMAIEAIGASAQKWVGDCQRTTKDVYVLDD